MFSWNRRVVSLLMTVRGGGAALCVAAFLAGAASSAAQPAAAAEPPSEASVSASQGEGEGSAATEDSAAAPEADTSSAGDPNWFAEALARDGDALPEVEVAAEDGYFKARVAAKLSGPVQTAEGSYFFTFQWTTQSGSFGECYVYNHRRDMASSLVAFSNQIFDTVPGTYRAEIEAKGVLDVDSGHIAGAPYMGVSWLFRTAVTETQGPLAGQAKHWIANKGENGVYCRTTYLGYDQTFFDLFAGLVASLEVQETPAQTPYFEEVTVIQIHEQNLGVAATGHFVNQAGVIERRENVSMLIPADQQNLLARDAFGITYADFDGALLSQVEVDAENGEIVSQLRLIPDDDGTWSVSGTSQGKELDVNLGPGAPQADFRQRLDFAELIKTAEPGAVMVHQAWSPMTDPTRWDEVKVTYQGPHDDGLAVSLQFGTRELTGVSDENMTFKRLSSGLESTSMVMEGVFERGDVWHPKTLTGAASAESSGAAPLSDQASSTGSGS